MRRNDGIVFSAGLAIAAAAITLGCTGLAPRSRSTGQEFFRQYAIGLHGAFSQAAAAVEDGGIKTDVELLEFLRPRTESARQEAAKTIDQYMEARISNGELKRSDAEELRALAKMFKDASP